MSAKTTVDLTKPVRSTTASTSDASIPPSVPPSTTETVDLTKPPAPSQAITSTAPIAPRPPSSNVAPVPNVAPAEPEAVEEITQAPDAQPGVPKVEQPVQVKRYRPMNPPQPKTNPVRQTNPAFFPRAFHGIVAGLQDPPQSLLLTDRNGQPLQDRTRSEANRNLSFGVMKAEEADLLGKIELATEDLKYNRDALKTGEINIGHERDLKGLMKRVKGYQEQLLEIRAELRSFARKHPDLEADVYSTRGLLHKTTSKSKKEIQDDQDVKSARIQARRLNLEIDDLQEKLRSPQGLSEKERRRLEDLSDQSLKAHKTIANMTRMASIEQSKHRKRERDIKAESDYMGRSVKYYEDDSDSD
jgi:hypothetical protein